MADEQPTPPPAPQQSTAQKIDAWFEAHFHNSPVSRNTEIFNHCKAALADLKKRLGI